MARRRRARPHSYGGQHTDIGALQYKYVWRLHAMLLPDGTPLKCAQSGGKNVCATLIRAEKAAEALEAIDGLRMVAYHCHGTDHYHVARALRHVQSQASQR
jgi:hypothetical protein